MPALIRDGAAVEIRPGVPFVDAHDISRPGNWLDRASTAEIAEAGVQDIAEPPEAPAGKRHVPGGLTVEGAKVVRVYVVEDLPPPSADEIRAAINTERDRRIRQPFGFIGHTFDYDEPSQARITGAATLAGFAQIAGAELGDLRWHGGASDFVWIAHDNALVPMDAPTCLAFGKAAAAWESAHVFAARVLKDRLDAGEDPASIDITQGWPTP